MLSHRYLEIIGLVVVVGLVFSYVVGDAAAPEVGPGQPVVEGFVAGNHTDTLGPSQQQPVFVEEDLTLVQGSRESVAEVSNPFGPALRHIRHHPADPGRGSRDPGAGVGLVKRIDPLSFLEGIEERSERPHIHGEGAEPEEMAEDPVQLHHDDPGELAALRHLNPHHGFHAHDMGAVVDEGRQIIHPVRQRDDLVPRPVLGKLFERGMEVSDVGRAFDHRLPVQLADEPEYPMSGGVLGSDVDQHVVGLQVGLREVDGCQRAHGGPPIHTHLRVSAESELDGFMGHRSRFRFRARA